MAFTVTARHSGNSNETAAQTLVTGSTTPTASSLLLVFAGKQANNDGVNPSTWQAPVGGSLTYTQIAVTSDYAFAGDGAYLMSGCSWRAPVGGSPSAHTITVDSYTGTTTAFYNAVACDVTGHNSTTPVAQSATNGADFGSPGNSNAGSVTLGSSPTTGNLVLAYFSVGADLTGAITAPTIGGQAMTQLFSQTNRWTHGALFYRVITGAESNAVVSCSDLGQQVGQYAAIVVEIAADPGGGTQNITPGAVTVTASAGTLVVTQGQAVIPAATTVTATPGTVTVSVDQAVTPAPVTVGVTPGAVSVLRDDQLFITDVAGTGTASHFVDQNGDPILIRGDTNWAIVFNAGRYGGATTWQSDVDDYVAARASQGYNAVYFAALGSTANNGVSDNGDTWDSVSPWDTDPGDLNEAYWERVDRLVDRLLENGMTAFFDAIYGAEDIDPALGSATTTQFGNYGTALGNRYKDYPNIVWALGADFNGQVTTHDADLTEWLTELRATGDTHLVSIENQPETTSRWNADDEEQHWGNDNAQYNSVYTYNVTYWMVEYAWGEASPLPVVWTDGHYAKDFADDDKVMRDLVWWAYSSGSRGHVNGSEGVWAWDSGALATSQTEDWSTNVLPAIQDFFASLPGWHLLAPDVTSAFVTAGRGTHASPFTPGGSGGEYDSSDTQDTYVTAGVTADGSLAVVYCPVSTTITIDDSVLAAGYGAIWVDPADPTQTSVATPSGANYTTPGTNSAGDSGWALVFQTGGAQGVVPGATTVVVTAGTASLSIGVVPAAATVVVSAGSVSLSIGVVPEPVTVAVTAGTVTLGAVVDMAAPTVAVTPGTVVVSAGATGVIPEAVTVTATAGALTVTTDAVNITPEATTVTVTAGSLSVVPDQPVTPAAVTVTATAGTVTVSAGAVDVTPSATTVTVTPGTVTVALGGAIVADAGAVTATAGTLTVTTGAVDVEPDATTVTVTAGSVVVRYDVTPEPTTVTATAGALTITTGEATVTPEATTVTVTPGTLLLVTNPRGSMSPAVYARATMTGRLT